MKIEVYLGDIRETIDRIPSNSVQCIITSPPYYGLRDYGTAKWIGGKDDCDHNPQRPDGGQRSDRSLPLGRGGMYKDVCGKCGAFREDKQIGLEKSPSEYVSELVSIFSDCKRVLKEDGTFWLNIGDNYAGSGKGGIEERKNNTQRENAVTNISRHVDICKPKDLIGIPWMVAFALRDDGWYLRSEIVWHKLNPMPESVDDRPTCAHEKLFLFAKSSKYFYDKDAVSEYGVKEKRNLRNVWSLNLKPYKGAHFATFPEDLILPCIKAGSKEDDIVFDPFGGSGTTALVSYKNRRNSILCELNPEYVKLCYDRLLKSKRIDPDDIIVYDDGLSNIQKPNTLSNYFEI